MLRTSMRLAEFSARLSIRIGCSAASLLTRWVHTSRNVLAFAMFKAGVIAVSLGAVQLSNPNVRAAAAAETFQA